MLMEEELPALVPPGSDVAAVVLQLSRFLLPPMDTSGNILVRTNVDSLEDVEDDPFPPPPDEEENRPSLLVFAFFAGVDEVLEEVLLSGMIP